MQAGTQAEVEAGVEVEEKDEKAAAGGVGVGGRVEEIVDARVGGAGVETVAGAGTIP